MSSSEERVGGVEPETVTLWRWTRRDGHGWMRHRLDLPGPWESQEFVPLSALRLVEEELRQAREVAANMKAHYEEALSNRDRAIASIRADRDRLAAALRKIAGQEPVKNALHPQWGAAHIAEAALSPVQGEHEQDGDTA